MAQDRQETARLLARLGPERLAAELLDLADGDREIAKRLKLLVREGDPAALATELKRRISGLKRSSRFVPYGESFGFARQVEEIARAIAEKVLPLDPATAFELADRFLATDRKTFGRVDDSAGVVADVYREACDTWLRAAAGARGRKDWVDRIYRVAADDGYGVRERLLGEAGILLSEHELRRLAKRYEDEAREGIDRSGPGTLRDESFGARVRMSLVAEALRDPVLYERSQTLRGKDLNDRQLLDVARHYLEYGQPEPAIGRLEAIGQRGWEEWQLLAEAYGKSGRRDEQLRCLWGLFERSASFETWEELLGLIPAGERREARERARRVALGFGDVQSGVRFLLRLGEPEKAEHLLVGRAAELEGAYYAHLKSLAELAAEHDRPMIEMLCYRELLGDILREARYKAYGHAARYFRRLAELDGRIGDYGALVDHGAFVDALRQRHGRKSSFWKKAEG